MPASDYYVGLLFFAATYGAIFAATEIVVRRRLPGLAGTMRVLAWAVIATLGLVASSLLPATLTVLSRETALVVAIALLIGALVLPAVARREPVGFPEPAIETTSLDRALASVGVAAFVIWILYAARQYLYFETEAYDAVSAYMPMMARWLQDGSIWEIANWVPNVFYGSGPGNGSMVVLSSVLPWNNDFLAHLIVYPFVLLTALALYALAREFRAPPTAAALAGVMLAAIPMVAVPGIQQGLLDPILYAAFAIGLTFLARHARTAESSDLVIAGLALGLAFGAKYYGYTAVPALVVVWVVARLWCRVELRTVVRQGLAIAALVIAAGGIWMLRNWIDAGNPLNPLGVQLAGVTIFDAPPDPLREVIGTTLASYVTQPQYWGELVHQFRIAVGVPMVVLLITLGLTGALLVIRRRRGIADDGDRLVVAAIAAVLVLFTAYAVTPYSAPGLNGVPIAAAVNVRYGIPAFIAAVATFGWISGRLGRGGLLALEALALVGLIETLRVGAVTSTTTVWKALILGAAATAALALARRLGVPRRMPSRVVVAGAAGVVMIAVALGGQRVQDRLNGSRYESLDPVLDTVITSSDGDPKSIGIAGTWSHSGIAPIYPSFGTRLQNRVEYVGPTDQGLLRMYRDRAAFIDRLQRSAYDLVVVGRAPPLVLDPARLGVSAPLPVLPNDPPEARWAEQAGYSEIGRSDRLILLSRS